MLGDLRGVKTETHLKQSLTDRVTETIRDAIVSRQIPSGDRLVETKIAKELSVSITPVRAAFLELAKRGLLTILPYRETFVSHITQAYIDDVILARRYLEIAAIETAFPQLTAADAKNLEQLSIDSDHALKEDRDLIKSNKYDVLFHRYFFEKAESALLLAMWEILEDRIEYIQAYTRPAIEIDNYLINRHSGIINGILDRDLSSTCQSMLDHIEQFRNRAYQIASKKISQ